MVRFKKKKDPKRNSRDDDNGFGIPVISFEEPQESLVPRWGNIWTSPDDPADPRDCDRYPDSPWCGGFPFDKRPVAIDLEVVADGCNLGIQASPVAGFVKLPKQQIVWRNPDCEDESKNPYYPPPPLGGGLENIGALELPDNPWVFVVVAYSRSGAARRQGISKTYKESYYDIVSVSNVECIPDLFEEGVNTLKISFKRKYFYESDYPRWGEEGKVTNESGSALAHTPFAPLNNEYVWKKRANLIYPEHWIGKIGIDRDVTSYDDYPAAWSHPKIFGGRAEDIKEYLKSIPTSSRHVWSEGSTSSSYRSSVVAVFNLLGCEFLRPPNNNPPPPKFFYPCDCMRCCKKTPFEEDKEEEQDLKLEELCATVDKIAQAVGVEEYPATLPGSLITYGGKNAKPVEVKNLSKMMEWFILRFDELMGEWEIPIDVKDIDPATEGDQGLSIRIPNLAEAVGELYQLVLDNNINLKLSQNLLVKNLIETGQVKVQGFRTNLIAEAIQQYLGFPVEEDTFKMPLLYTPNAKNTPEFIQISEQLVEGIEYTGEGQNLAAALLNLLRGAAITNSVHFRKLDLGSKTAMGQQMVDIIKGLNDSESATRNAEQGSKDSDLKAFIRETKVGFKNTPGVTQNPHDLVEPDIRIVGEEGRTD